MAELHDKRGEQRLFYFIDMRPYLHDGESVVAASATVDPVSEPEMQIQRMEYAADAVLVWLSGGRDAERYLVRASVRTSGRRTWLITFAVVTHGDAEPGEVILLSAEQLSDGVAAGVAPQLMASPPSVTFPDTAAGATSAPVAVSISNIGSAPATVRSITLTGPFAFTSDAEGRLDAGEDFTLLVRFKPLARGSATGILTVAGNVSATLALSGRAT
jgi:hypothetical protein